MQQAAAGYVNPLAGAVESLSWDWLVASFSLHDPSLAMARCLVSDLPALLGEGDVHSLETSRPSVWLVCIQPMEYCVITSG